jgi:hypothetical protein
VRAPAAIAEDPAGSRGNLDPDSAMQELARLMRDAYTQDPGNSNLAREYRMTLLALAPRRDDAIQTELDALLADLSKPVPGDDS